MNAPDYRGQVMPGQLTMLLNEVTQATKAPFELVASIGLAAISTVVQQHCRMSLKRNLAGR